MNDRAIFRPRWRMRLCIWLTRLALRLRLLNWLPPCWQTFVVGPGEILLLRGGRYGTIVMAGGHLVNYSALIRGIFLYCGIVRFGPLRKRTFAGHSMNQEGQHYGD